MIQTKSFWSFALTAWLSLAFLYLPILVVIVFSFNVSPFITNWSGFSFGWYLGLLDDDGLQRALMNSLIVGVGATIGSTFVALITALAIGQKQAKVPGGIQAQLLMNLPLLVPEIVIAVASLSFFSFIGLNLGIGNVLITHIVFCIPFAYSPIRTRLESIPQELAEASSDLYATQLQTFRKVTLPLLRPGIYSGAMLAFITSLDDFMITQMVAPPGAQTLPVHVYNMVRRGITPEINAISSLLLVFSMFIVACSYHLSKKRVC